MLLLLLTVKNSFIWRRINLILMIFDVMMRRKKFLREREAISCALHFFLFFFSFSPSIIKFTGYSTYCSKQQLAMALTINSIMCFAKRERSIMQRDVMNCKYNERGAEMYNNLWLPCLSFRSMKNIYFKGISKNFILFIISSKFKIFFFNACIKEKRIE